MLVDTVGVRIVKGGEGDTWRDVGERKDLEGATEGDGGAACEFCKSAGTPCSKF